MLLTVTAAAGTGSLAALPAMAWIAVVGVVVATALFRTAPLVGLLIGAAALVGYHVTVNDPLGLAWPLAVVIFGVARAGSCGSVPGLPWSISARCSPTGGSSIRRVTAGVTARRCPGRAADGALLLGEVA